MKISPSILAANPIDLKSQLALMQAAVVDFIHMDVMDGHFVPTLSFGEAYTAAVQAATDIPLDVHLMVSRPEMEIPKYIKLAPHIITFHLEANAFPIRLAQSIRAEGIKAGISLNPGTSVELLEPILDEIDLVLIMSVEPGFYGQSFIASSLRKIVRLKEMIGNRNILIEVDGGVNLENIASIKEAGTDLCVAGSAAFKDGNVNANVIKLKDAAAGGLDR